MPPMDEEPDGDALAVNRAVWTEINARHTDARALAEWQAPDITWGTWHIPEAQVRTLPASLAGLDVVELGCGTAYFSAWLAQRGARPVGVDPTPAQLATARRCQRELDLPFPLVGTARRSGPTPTVGFRRRRACSAPAGASSFYGPPRW
jgi:SAM-dependent methyltransferase